MERNYIDVNLPNVITIVLIGLAGTAIFKFLQKLYSQAQGGSSVAKAS